jgi:hypothetical protein
LVGGVVDVAHLVTTHALAEGDLNTARAATQIAASAAPCEEIPRLDLAAIADAAGHRQEAALIIRDEVQPIRRRPTTPRTVGKDRADPGFSRLAAADEVGVLIPALPLPARIVTVF